MVPAQLRPQDPAVCRAFVAHSCHLAQSRSLRRRVYAHPITEESRADACLHSVRLLRSGRQDIVRYLIFHSPYQVVSVARLCRYVYIVSSDYKRTTLLWRGHRSHDMSWTAD